MDEEKKKEGRVEGKVWENTNVVFGHSSAKKECGVGHGICDVRELDDRRKGEKTAKGESKCTWKVKRGKMARRSEKEIHGGEVDCARRRIDPG